MAPLVLGEASGIELVSTTDSQVSQNTVHHNGEGGVQIRVGATRSIVRGNRIFENGTQRMSDFSGRGIMIARPAGTAPIGGNFVAQNRLHGNYRSGVALMGPIAGNTVVQNDARDNNLSGLAPCYRCNLVDLSVGRRGFAMGKPAAATMLFRGARLRAILLQFSFFVLPVANCRFLRVFSLT